MAKITFDDFLKVDVRVGEVIQPNPIRRRENPRSNFGSILDRKLGKNVAPPKSQPTTSLKTLLASKSWG